MDVGSCIKLLTGVFGVVYQLLAGCELVSINFLEMHRDADETLHPDQVHKPEWT